MVAAVLPVAVAAVPVAVAVCRRPDALRRERGGGHQRTYREVDAEMEAGGAAGRRGADGVEMGGDGRRGDGRLGDRRTARRGGDGRLGDHGAARVRRGRRRAAVRFGGECEIFRILP